MRPRPTERVRNSPLMVDFPGKAQAFFEVVPGLVEVASLLSQETQPSLVECRPRLIRADLRRVAGSEQVTRHVVPPAGGKDIALEAVQFSHFPGLPGLGPYVLARGSVLEALLSKPASFLEIADARQVKTYP